MSRKSIIREHLTSPGKDEDQKVDYVLDNDEYNSSQPFGMNQGYRTNYKNDDELFEHVIENDEEFEQEYDEEDLDADANHSVVKPAKSKNNQKQSLEDSVLNSSSRQAKKAPQNQQDQYKRTKEEKLRLKNEASRFGGKDKHDYEGRDDEEEVNIQDVDFKIVGVQDDHSDINGPITNPGHTEAYNGFDSQNLSNSERKGHNFDASHKGLIGNGIDESIKMPEAKNFSQRLSSIMRKRQKTEDNGAKDVDDSSKTNEQIQSMELVEDVSCSHKCWNILKTLFNIMCFLFSFFNYVLALVYQNKERFASYNLFLVYIGFIVIKPIILTLIFISKIILTLRRKSIELPPDTERANEAEEQEETSFCGKFFFHFSQTWMTQFGAHRFISLQQQPVTVILGYALELINQVVPFLFLQTVNNNTSNTPVLSQLSQGAIAFGFMNLVLIFFEIINVFCKKAKYNKIDQSQRVSLTENQIILVYRKKQFLISISIFLLLLVTLVPAHQLVPGMQCGPRQGYKGSTCMYCDDVNCAFCQKDYAKCETCHGGFYLDKLGQCEPCSSYGCSKCNTNDICQECRDGFRLEFGRCTRCSNMQNCAECDNSKCLRCNTGFTMDPTDTKQQKCISCSSNIRYCDECSSLDKCNTCTSGIATQVDGTCQCDNVNGWYQKKYSDQCLCDYFVESSSNHCYTCDQLISGCSSCENVNNFDLSYQYIGLSSHNPSQKQYLKCTSCNNGYFFAQNHAACQKCDTVVPKCSACNTNGSKCINCSDGYFLDFTSNPLKTAGECLSCLQQIDNCENCLSKDHCTRCASGFTLNQSTHKCEKTL